MQALRKIIHVDMDAFYASVEQRDNPHLKGKPVIVGGDPRSRGVVAACSYEARRIGIHSAMAYRLWPQAIFIRPPLRCLHSRFSSNMGDLFRYTERVEPLSLDEAFLDVTENKPGFASATQIAQQIR
jgi:DNA polymerase-4